MKSPAVLDTNVVSFIYGGKREAKLYDPEITGRRLILSFQTVAELRHGAALHDWTSARRESLTAFIYALEIKYCDDEVVDAWADLMTTLTRKRQPLSVADTWIAATAIALDLPLLAHDKAFRRVPGLDLICKAP